MDVPSSYSCWEGNIQNKRLFYNFTKHNSAFPKGQTWCFDYLCCISKSSSFTCTFVILLVYKRSIIKFYCKKRGKLMFVSIFYNLHKAKKIQFFVFLTEFKIQSSVRYQMHYLVRWFYYFSISSEKIIFI